MKYQNVLVFLVTLLCSCLSFGSQAQAATKPQSQAPTARIVEFGIYEVVKKGIQYEHKESTAGFAEQGGEVALVKRTTEIPLENGIVFGFDWEADGLPGMPIKIIWRVKHPQTVKPDGTVSMGFDEELRVEPKEGRIKKRTDCYILGEDWEMLPGEWSLSVVYEGRVLCEKVFHIAAPDLTPLPSHLSTKSNREIIELKVDLRKERELQEAVDEGHQPWRLEPISVAAAALAKNIGGTMKFESCRIKSEKDIEAEVECKSNNNYVVTLKRLVRPTRDGVWTAVKIEIEK
jgi:hypothetical protein